MRLYHHPMSTCSLRVRLAAQHLGVALDLVPIDLSRGEQHAPAFAKLNPNHQVPVLEHDGFVLWESYAIMQYLADLTPGQTLYPAEARARADVNRWLFWCGQVWMPGVALLNWEQHIKPLIGQGPADAAQVARGEQLLRSAAERLDAHLADGRTWLCASSLSLADLALAAPLADQDAARLPVRDLPHLQRWFRQVQALDAWAQAAPTAPPTAA